MPKKKALLLLTNLPSQYQVMIEWASRESRRMTKILVRVAILAKPPVLTAK